MYLGIRRVTTVIDEYVYTSNMKDFFYYLSYRITIASNTRDLHSCISQPGIVHYQVELQIKEVEIITEHMEKQR